MYFYLTVCTFEIVLMLVIHIFYGKSFHLIFMLQDFYLLKTYIDHDNIQLRSVGLPNQNITQETVEIFLLPIFSYYLLTLVFILNVIVKRK